MGTIDRQYSYIGILLFSVFLGFYIGIFLLQKIFIGDSGSIPIGFFIGSIIVSSFINEKGVYFNLFIGYLLFK